MSGVLEDKGRLTAAYNAADTLRAGTAPGLIDLVDKVTQSSQHVFFGEPHIDGMATKQYEMLANNYGIFRAAAHNGVKHLALEFPSGYQPDVDDYMVGKISQDELKKKLSEDFSSPWFKTEQDKDAFLDGVARTIGNARSAGMKVHLADVTSNELASEMLPPQVQSLVDEHREKNSLSKEGMVNDSELDTVINEQPPEQRGHLRDMVQKHLDEWWIKRMDDSQQYSYLRERIPQGEGIMGVVGLSHLNNNLDEKHNHKTRGIDDYLAEEGTKVTTIEMHTSKSKEIMQNLYAETGARAVDRPDYTVVLDQKEIISGEDVRIGRIDRPLPEQEDMRLASYKHQALPSLSN